MITVTKKSDALYEVTVQAASTTTHAVTLTEDVHRRLVGESVSAEILIEKSFEFMLQRESNTMILRRFDLQVINTYFPEYEREISQACAS